MGVELEKYDEDLEKWKSEVKANGRQTTMEVMDALATMMSNQHQSSMDAKYRNLKQSVMDANVNGKQSRLDADVKSGVKQSGMDAVALVKPTNSWDTKRKNLRRMQKRKLKDAKTDEENQRASILSFSSLVILNQLLCTVQVYESMMCSSVVVVLQ